MAKIPNYAAHVPHHLQLLCKSKCGRTSYAELKEEKNPMNPKPEEKYARYVAYCLRCGGRALDNYNWMRP